MARKGQGLRRRRIVLSAAMVVSGFLANSKADTLTWIGTGTGNWSNPGNWLGGIPPVSSRNNSITFSSNANSANQDISSDFQLNNLTFASAAGNLSLAGGTLDFRTNSSSVAPTLVQNNGSIQFISKKNWPGFLTTEKQFLAEVVNSRNSNAPPLRWSDEESLGPSRAIRK